MNSLETTLAELRKLCRAEVEEKRPTYPPHIEATEDEQIVKIGGTFPTANCKFVNDNGDHFLYAEAKLWFQPAIGVIAVAFLIKSTGDSGATINFPEKMAPVQVIQAFNELYAVVADIGETFRWPSLGKMETLASKYGGWFQTG